VSETSELRHLEDLAVARAVLVVEDDQAVRTLLAITLMAAGMRVVEAGTGHEALDLIGRESFAAVVLDNHLPGLSGLEVLEHLRSRRETVTLPVILVSGDDEVADRVKGLQGGANDYIVKPFDPAELVARVQAQLHWQSRWTSIIETHSQERSAIAGVLSEVTSGATAAEMAGLVCAGLAALGHYSGAGLLGVLAPDVVVPLAVFDLDAWNLQASGRPLPSMLASHLAAKADQGPWIEYASERGAADPAVGWMPEATLACVPLHYRGHAVGLLLLGADPPNGHASAADVGRVLSEAIDFATIVAGLLGPTLHQQGEHDRRGVDLEALIREGRFSPVFQPLVRLADREVVGYEALTRFDDGIRPDVRFAEASRLGLGLELELATISAALDAATTLPAGRFVSLNISPALALAGQPVRELLARTNRPLVLELTEHDPVEDYVELRAGLDGLTPNTHVSVDDAGSGFASLRHILELTPEFVKLDQTWVLGIDTDPARQALVAGLCHFAGATGCRLIAEGIETDSELAVLRGFEVELGQGFLLGRPIAAGA
jgi:EAL domain-containing protein (putative c-di-GMP-specific phosphodiesterase class I)/CheY-like chemotaxis protein